MMTKTLLKTMMSRPPGMPGWATHAKLRYPSNLKNVILRLRTRLNQGCRSFTVFGIR